MSEILSYSFCISVWQNVINKIFLLLGAQREGKTFKARGKKHFHKHFQQKLQHSTNTKLSGETLAMFKF